MTTWHPDGQPANLAYSPELWEWLADLGVGLDFDLSHLPRSALTRSPRCTTTDARRGHLAPLLS